MPAEVNSDIKNQALSIMCPLSWIPPHLSLVQRTLVVGEGGWGPAVTVSSHGRKRQRWKGGSLQSECQPLLVCDVSTAAINRPREKRGAGGREGEEGFAGGETRLDESQGPV